MPAARASQLGGSQPEAAATWATLASKASSKAVWSGASSMGPTPVAAAVCGAADSAPSTKFASSLGSSAVNPNPPCAEES